VTIKADQGKPAKKATRKQKAKPASVKQEVSFDHVCA
jgi:hypothetical protein